MTFPNGDRKVCFCVSEGGKEEGEEEEETNGGRAIDNNIQAAHREPVTSGVKDNPVLTDKVH